MRIEWTRKSITQGRRAMTDSEYKTLADAFFGQLEQALEQVDAGLDFELAAGGIL